MDVSRTDPPDSSRTEAPLVACRRHRLVVVAVAAAALAVKLVVAARTFGTSDIKHWTDFVNGVAAHGPVGVYAVDFPRSFYNHPPLIGYFLEFVRFAANHGLSIQFTLRAVSSLADVASAVLLYELLARRRAPSEALLGAVLLAASPVLFDISGFHGNTDPIFLMFVLLSVHLLADRDRPGLAGAAIALAIGVKIVPVVVVPVLLVWAVTRGRRTTIRFAVGFAVAFLFTWGPALVLQGHNVRSHVLGYAGDGVSQWGISQLGHWLGDPAWLDVASGSGRFAIVAVCSCVPAVLVWRRPAVVAEGAGLALVAFLFLSTAFGTQYTVWGLAAYLFSVRLATVYNLAAGALVATIYTHWAGGLPWHEADWHSFTRGEVAAGIGVWAVLGALVVTGTRTLWAGAGITERSPIGGSSDVVHGRSGEVGPAGKEAGAGAPGAGQVRAG